MIGKWHLGQQPQFYPMKRGYQEFVGFLPGATLYMDPSDPGVHSFEEPTANGQKGRGVYGQIIEGPDATVVHNEHEYLTDYFSDRAVGFIRERSANAKPWFLYLSYNAVHSPMMVTDKYYARHPEIKDELLRIYAGMVDALDEGVGRVLDAIEASGEADNTIVIFLSDNGCAAYYPGLCSCEPLRGGKLTHFEGGMRVPFMMRWPSQIKAGMVYRDMISSLDIFPTSMAAAGGVMPADRAYDGSDIMPFLKGQAAGSPHESLAWRRRPLVSVRQGDWKLWESVGDKTGEYGDHKLLYNLKEDENETTNLADRFPEKVRELEGLIQEWSKSMTDPAWPSRPPATYSVCGTPFTVPI